jgi:hypothetical protein
LLPLALLCFAGIRTVTRGGWRSPSPGLPAWPWRRLDCRWRHPAATPRHSRHLHPGCEGLGHGRQLRNHRYHGLGAGPCRLLRVVRCERRMSLTANVGCWHARRMGIHAALMLAPRWSPRRPQSEPTISRMPSRTVATGPACGAQVSAFMEGASAPFAVCPGAPNAGSDGFSIGVCAVGTARAEDRPGTGRPAGMVAAREVCHGRAGRMSPGLVMAARAGAPVRRDAGLHG